jgi:hypothetical protein
MRWRDIRFEKPTAADADKDNKILQLGSSFCCRGDWDDTRGLVAWMPMSELPKFERVPNPPKGWRYKVDGDVFDNRAQYWSPQSNKFLLAWQDDAYDSSLIYIVPIDPPAPTYRPFANAAEFEPYRDKWIRNAHGSVRRVGYYSDAGLDGMSWDMLFRNRTFDDGTPCGVKVSE